MRVYVIFSALLVLSIFELKAQEAELGNWLVYIGNKQIQNKWNWEQSVQYRSYNGISDLHQLLIRNGIGLNLSKNNNNLSIGYDYILDKQYDNKDVKSISNTEHRIYQQFLTKQHLGRFYWKHRYRFEERFINDNLIKFRFRYALFLNIPINRKKVIAKTIFLSAYNEFFLAKPNILNQDWLYGGVGYKLSEQLIFELGYMNQFLGSKYRDQLNMIMKISF